MLNILERKLAEREGGGGGNDNDNSVLDLWTIKVSGCCVLCICRSWPCLQDTKEFVFMKVGEDLFQV